MYTSLFTTKHRRKPWVLVVECGRPSDLACFSDLVYHVPSCRTVASRATDASIRCDFPWDILLRSLAPDCLQLTSVQWTVTTTHVACLTIHHELHASSLRRNHCITILQYGIRRKCVISNKFWCVVTFDCINQDLPRTWESYPSTIYQNACLSVCLSVL